MEQAPAAPWTLEGRAVVLATGPAPGSVVPGVLIAARYDRSPVGPYVELALGRASRRGVHLGATVTTMVVTSAASRAGGRTNWGFPKELGTVTWEGDAADVHVRWEEGGLTLAARAVGPTLPMWAPWRALQQLDGAPVAVPGVAGRRVRAAWGEVSLDRDVADRRPDVAHLAGRHVGGLVDPLHLVVRRADLLR